MQHKFCPLIKGDCYESLCAFCTGDQCAITAIAENMRDGAARDKKLGKKLDNISGCINGVWGELRERY